MAPGWCRRTRLRNLLVDTSCLSAFIVKILSKDSVEVTKWCVASGRRCRRDACLPCAMRSVVEQRCHQSVLRSRTPVGGGSDKTRTRKLWTPCLVRPHNQSKSRPKNSRFQIPGGGHLHPPPEPSIFCRCTRDTEETHVAWNHKLGNGGRAVRLGMRAGAWPVQVSGCGFESV